jgi:ribosomal subunit interface protein
MRLELTCRDVELTERMHARIERKAAKLATHLRDPGELHLTLRRERHSVRAELVARGTSQRLQSHAEGKTVRQAVDGAVSRLLRSLKRSRERSLDQVHHGVNREDGFKASA